MKVKRINCQYGNRTIIENLSMQAEFGEIIGLVALMELEKPRF